MASCCGCFSWGRVRPHPGGRGHDHFRGRAGERVEIHIEEPTSPPLPTTSHPLSTLKQKTWPTSQEMLPYIVPKQSQAEDLTSDDSDDSSTVSEGEAGGYGQMQAACLTSKCRMCHRENFKFESILPVMYVRTYVRTYSAFEIMKTTWLCPTVQPLNYVALQTLWTTHFNWLSLVYRGCPLFRG